MSLTMTYGRASSSSVARLGVDLSGAMLGVRLVEGEAKAGMKWVDVVVDERERRNEVRDSRLAN
jgi:hypothetical protein